MLRKKIFLSMLVATLAVGAISYAGYRTVNGFAGGIFGRVMAEANEFDALSKPIILDLVDKGWQPDAVRHYATPGYAATLGTTSALFDTLRELGKVTSFSSRLVLEKKDTGRNGTVETRTAAVARDITFEKGERRVELDFLWQDKQWRLSGVQAVL